MSLSKEEQARRIAAEGKGLDYEQEALDSLQRSWELDDSGCAALALADAGVWATLHLARRTESEMEVLARTAALRD